LKQTWVAVFARSGSPLQVLGSGGTRTLVAKQHAAAIFFLLGREKSSPGTDFSDAAVEAVKLIGANLQIQPMSKLDEMKFNASLKEICNDKKNQ